jgi:hypothetical protein
VTGPGPADGTSQRRRGSLGLIATAWAARHTMWGLFDQALSSATNFALSIAVARQVTAPQFGAYSIAFAAYLVALTVSRAIATDPLTIRYSAKEVAAWQAATARAGGTAIAIGLVAGALCLGTAVIVGGDTGAALGPLAVGLPALLLQDAWRYAFFAARRGRDAFLNDLAWTIALAIALVFVATTGSATVGGLVAAWAFGGAAGALFGIGQTGIRPTARIPEWLREHRDIAPRMAVEGIILSGSQQVLLVAISLVAGLASVAAVRAGQVLMNALHIATYGVYLAVVPEGVRLLNRSAAGLRRLCVVVAVGLGSISLAWGLVLVVLPDSIGRALLGDTWTPAHGVIVPLAIVTAGAGVQTGAVVGLRALAAARRSLRARSVSSALLFGCGFAGAIVAGANGTAWGMAIGVSIGSLVWWLELTRGLAAAGPSRVDAVTTDLVRDVETGVGAG